MTTPREDDLHENSESRDDHKTPSGLERELFIHCLELTSDTDRAAFLKKACGANRALRRHIEDLLDRQARNTDFLDKPVLEQDTALDSPSNQEGLGSVIGHYKILQEIGKGGFGIVYRARQEKPVSRDVALKIIKMGMDTKQVIGRFETERQALAMMDHPNIAKVLDAGSTESGRPFFVMELVRGIPITEYCDKAKLDIHERLEIFVQVCMAVQHAHQKGIIHRDIKPNNVLVTLHDGVPVPKIIDFGIAKATQQRLTDVTVFTHLNQFIGTPPYMSPEQAEMSGLDVDTRSDIYSLGVLLYEILTGRPPFTTAELLQDGIDAMRKRICLEDPPKPSTVLSTMSLEQMTVFSQERSVEAGKLSHLFKGELDWIILKSLEKDRNRRYETATAFRDDILRFLNSEPVTAVAPTPYYKLKKYAKRNTATFVVATTIALCLLVSSIISSVFAIYANRQRVKANNFSIEANKERQEKENKLYAADIREAQQEILAGNFQEAKELLTPYQQHPLKGWEWNYLMRQTDGDPHEVVADLGMNAVMWSDLSKDRSLMALSSTDGQAGIWSVQSQSFVWKTTSTTPYKYDVSISPDGRYVVAGHLISMFNHPTTALLWDSRHDAETPITNNPSFGQTAQFSPNHNFLAISEPGDSIIVYDISKLEGDAEDYFSPSDNKNIVFNRPATPLNQRRKFIVGDPSSKLAFSSDGRLLAYGLDGNAFLEVVDLLTGKIVRPKTRLHLDPGVAPKAWNAETWKLNFCQSDKTVASTTLFSEPIFVDIASGNVSQPLGKTGEQCMNLRESPNGRFIAGACMDHTIRIWNSDDLTLLHELKGCSGELSTLEFIDEGENLLAITSDGELTSWNLAEQRKQSSWVEIPQSRDIDHPDLIFSPDGRFTYVANDHHVMTRIDLQSGSTTELEYKGIPIGFTKDGSELCSMTFLHHNPTELKVHRHDSEMGQTQLLSIPLTDNFSMLPNSKYAYCSSLNYLFHSDDFKTYQIYSLNSKKVVGNLTLEDPNHEYYEIAASKSGDTVATVVSHGDISNCSLFIYKRTGAQYKYVKEIPIPTPGRYPVRITISDNEKMVAMASNQHFFHLIDIQNETVSTMGWHLRGCNVVRFSPDSRSIASGSDEKVLRVWHLDTKRQLLSIQLDMLPLRINFSPNGKWLAASGGESVHEINRFQRWRIDSME